MSATTALSSSKKPRFSLSAFISRNRRAASALVVFVMLILIFMAAAPKVFLNPNAYTAIFVSLPISMVLAVSLVFVVSAGEIDLAFPAVFGIAAWTFSLTSVRFGLGPWAGLIVALATGALAGWINGLLVTRAKLSSLVSTLGMNFMLRGLINIGTQGLGIPLSSLRDTRFFQVFVGDLAGIPVQMFWGILLAIVGVILFNRHRFGADVCSIGDNQESAREMGINVARTKTYAYIYVGLSAAFAGVLSSMINSTFWPAAGDGYLLTTLAAVFVGGTPTWGGVGTVTGAAIGTFTVGFIETGIIAAGLTAFYTQFFYGLIIVLSLLGHRFNSPRYR